MKKIYLLSALCACGSVLFAQNIKPGNPSIKAFQARIESPITNDAGQLKSLDAPAPKPMAAFFSEDFESVTKPALPAGFTTSSNCGAGAKDAFYTGNNTDANAGGYWPVPAHTQFVMTNDDVGNCDKSLDYLTLPTLDFTGKTGMFMSFAAYDDGTYGGGPTTIQININGGGFNTIYTMTQKAAWQNISIPLTGTDNASSVVIRFHYDDMGEWGTGIAIDDIVIDLPPANDLALTDIYYYGNMDSTATKYYTRIPVKQAAKDTIVFGGKYTNKGGAAQPNSKVSVAVTGPATFNGSSTPVSLAPGATNAADVTSSFFLGGKGTYAINFSVSSDSTDAMPADNSMKDTIMVVDSVYARDNNTPFSGAWYPLQAPTNSYVIGNVFEVTEADMVTSVSHYVLNTQATSPYYQLGKLVSLQIYDLNGASDPTLIVENAFYDIKAADIGKWLTLGVTPTTLQPGWYLAAIEAFSDTTLFGTGAGAPKAPPLTTFVMVGGSWGYTTQSIPFVRMNMNSGISINESNAISAGVKVFPNPSNGVFNISFKDVEAGNYTLTVTDILGKEVYNSRINVNGNNALSLDLTSLTKGVYMLNVNNGTSTSNQKIVIR
jgi:hypothetical protein